MIYNKNNSIDNWISEQEKKKKDNKESMETYDIIAQRLGVTTPKNVQAQNAVNFMRSSIYKTISNGYYDRDAQNNLDRNIDNYRSLLFKLSNEGYDVSGYANEMPSIMSFAKRNKDLYGNYKTKDDFNGAILAGNILYQDESEGRAERGRLYGENQSRIAELEKGIAEKEKNGEDTSADEELLELLEAQNRQYERGFPD